MMPCPVCQQRPADFGIVVGSDGQRSFVLCDVCARNWERTFGKYEDPAPSDVIAWTVRRVRRYARRRSHA